jgi:hypothetical protein
MGAVYETLRHPYAIFYDFDRNRKSRPEIYGRYKPSKLKRLQCWLLNERIEPIDWEEVPPYVDNFDRAGIFVHPREGSYHPFEFVTQPDMVSEGNMYTRFALFGIFWFWLYKRGMHYPNFWRRIPFLRFYLRGNVFMRFLPTAWLYYIISRNYLNRNNQLPYN